jgi:hypothetical protein
MPDLTDDTIIEERIQAGKTSMQRVANRVRLACRRFKDPSLQYRDYVGEVDEQDESYDQAVGTVPYLATNIRTKVDAIAISDPDWHVEMREDQADSEEAQQDLLPPDASDVVKLYLRSLWETYHWQRVTKRSLTHRTISFKGIVAYLWEEDGRGPAVEHVPAWDLFIDPHVTDWDDLRFGGRRIYMPPDEARKRWPENKELFDTKIAGEDGGAAKRNSIRLWCYWDKTTECVMFEDTVLEKGENLYGKVPLIFLHGDINPLGEYDTGDYDTCTGMEHQATRITDAINAKATHGNTLTLWHPDAFDAQGKKALQTGQVNQFIPVEEGVEFQEAIFRLPGEPVTESEVSSLNAMRQALDEATAVNSYMRGSASGARFATEVATVVNQSGARGQTARMEYEEFLNKIAHAVLDMTLKFFKPQTPEELILLAAIQDVARIKVIESSTAYKDPALEQQIARQLWQDAMQMGSAGAPVNVMMFWERYLRACQIRDVKRFEMQPQPQQPASALPPLAAGQNGAAPASAGVAPSPQPQPQGA